MPTSKLDIVGAAVRHMARFAPDPSPDRQQSPGQLTIKDDIIPDQIKWSMGITCCPDEDKKLLVIREYSWAQWEGYCLSDLRAIERFFSPRMKSVQGKLVQEEGPWWFFICLIIENNQH